MSELISDYYRVREVAAKLAVSEQTVRKLVKTGVLDSIRVGKNSIRIPREAVENFTGVPDPEPADAILSANDFLRPVKR